MSFAEKHMDTAIGWCEHYELLSNTMASVKPAKSPEISGRLPDFDHILWLGAIAWSGHIYNNTAQFDPGILQTHCILL